MIDLANALRNYFKVEYLDFLEDCNAYDENPENYPSLEDVWCQSLRVLFKNKIIDSHGFCNKKLEECLELYGDLKLETFPILYANDYKEWPKLKFRTILNSKQEFIFNINDYIINEI